VEGEAGHEDKGKVESGRRGWNRGGEEREEQV